MTWMKLDTLVRTNRKLAATIVELGRADAAWLWLCASAYCRDALSDGFIPDYMLATMAPGFTEKMLKPLPDVLVRHGLWHRADGGYVIHDFLHHNPAKVEVEDKRKKDRDRKRGGVAEDSARNPEGLQEDSASHAGGRAARTSPSPSNSPGCSGSSEGVQGEPRPAVAVAVSTVPATPVRFVSPAAWDRVHGSHVTGFCDWFCLPADVFGQLATRLGGETEALAFARSVRADLVARKVPPTGRPWAFWEGQLEARVGSSQPARSATPGALDGVREALRHG